MDKQEIFERVQEIQSESDPHGLVALVGELDMLQRICATTNGGHSYSPDSSGSTLDHCLFCGAVRHRQRA